MEEKQNLIELVMVHVYGTPAELEQVRKVLSTKSEDELQRMAQKIRLQVQTEATRQSYVQLQIVRHGLANTDANWQTISQRLPGERLTLEGFRSLVSDPVFKQSLQWDAEPFAEVIHAEQQQSSLYRAHRRLFDAAANALTGQGTVDVAPNDANYALVVEALEEDGLDFTTDNVMNLLIRGGLELAPNAAKKELSEQSRKQLLETFESYLGHSQSESDSKDAFKIRGWIQNLSIPIADIRERLELVEEIANTLSPHQADRAYHFRKLVLSVKTGEELRQRVADIEKRRELSSLSREELRDRARREYEERHQQPQRITLLPAEITAEAIRKSSKDQQLAWHKQYGVDLLNARLRGES